jgi:hypothetical protein
MIPDILLERFFAPGRELEITNFEILVPLGWSIRTLLSLRLTSMPTSNEFDNEITSFQK